MAVRLKNGVCLHSDCSSALIIGTSLLETEDGAIHQYRSWGPRYDPDQPEIILNFVLPLIRIVYIFKSAMLACHCFDEPQMNQYVLCSLFSNVTEHSWIYW